MSWLEIHPKCPFSLENLPFGIISTSNRNPRPAVAISSYALDLLVFSREHGFSGLSNMKDSLHTFESQSLNAFAALGRPVHREVRHYLQEIFSFETRLGEVLRDNNDLREKALLPLDIVEMHLPMKIGDYTDFYAGRHHAFNCGVLFRGPSDALQPNYTHLPVAYHGRASSIVVSGTPIKRPWGQMLENPLADAKVPTLSPCRRLDIELELGAFICKSNEMGSPIPVNEAGGYLFGFVLLNDWSARDIQAWEYVPLGPFCGKNFASSISPWIVLADALEPFMCTGIKNDTPLLPYLREHKKENVYNINLEVELRSRFCPRLPTQKPELRLIAPNGSISKLCSTSSKYLLFSFPQMIAHHTIAGCNLQVGDLLGSGTISGPTDGQQGSLLELSQGGKVAISIGDEQRKFLEDNDIVIIRGYIADEKRCLIGFGECAGSIRPSDLHGF